jgi:hypothetical protein
MDFWYKFLRRIENNVENKLKKKMYSLLFHRNETLNPTICLFMDVGICYTLVIEFFFYLQ